MNTPSPNRVSVTVNPTFWDLFISSLILIRYQRALIIFHLIFPMAGLFIIVSSFCTGRSLGVQGLLVVLLAFSFTPLITALALWMARRRNKLAQGPFTYSFDSEGIHSSGAEFSSTIKWAAITRARQSGRFLFIFISPSRAFFIPLKTLTDQGVLDQVRTIAREHTDLR